MIISIISYRRFIIFFQNFSWKGCGDWHKDRNPEDWIFTEEPLRDKGRHKIWETGLEVHGPDLQGVSERQKIHRGQSRDHIPGQRGKSCSFGDKTVDMLGSSSSDTDWSWRHLTLRVTWLLRTSCQRWQECTLWSCYQTQVWLLSTWKSIIRQAKVSRQESFFNKKSQQSGEIVDLCPLSTPKRADQSPKRSTPKILLNCDKFKERKWEESQWIIKARDGFCILLHCMQTGWFSRYLFSHVTG